MPRVGLLTFQNTLNFGATLQNYALFRQICSLGYNATVIDYRSNRIEGNEFLLLSPRPKAALRYFMLRRKARLFDDFKKRMVLSNSCSRDEIAGACELVDCVIVGSDQVWNTVITGSDATYFLDFLDDSTKCKSYAASMGYAELPPCDYDLRPLISHFSSILVREKSAAEVIAKECPDAPNPHVVVDPTLLVEKFVWDEIEQTPEYALKTPYVLVYDVSESGAAFEAALRLADVNGAQIIRVQSYDLKPKPGMKSVLNVSPEEYLGLFAHAQATVVSSFHGLCFSIINHRDFYFSGQTTGKNTNSRATDLMESLGISGRTVQDLANGTVQPIDWDDVEARLADLRADSLRLLKESLADIEEA